MKQQLISFNEHAYNAEIRYANADLKLHNDLLTVIKANLPDFPIGIDAYLKLLDNPRQYAFDTLMGDTPLKVGGVSISKAKLMDLMELSPEWQAIVDAGNHLNSHFAATPQYKTGQGYAAGVVARLPLSALQLKAGVFIISQQFLDSVTIKHSIFTQNENQNLALQNLKGIQKSLINLQLLGINFDSDEGINLDKGFKTTGGRDGVPFGINLDVAGLIQQVK